MARQIRKAAGYDAPETVEDSPAPESSASEHAGQGSDAGNTGAQP
jgi:hypothetical protein